MLYDSFKASGYKYGVVSYPGVRENDLYDFLISLSGNDCNNIPTTMDMQKSLDIDPDCIVDFKDLFGLTIEDISSYSSLTYNHHLIFVMYDSVMVQKPFYTISSQGSSKANPQEQATVRYAFAIDTTKDKEMTIDDVICKHLIEEISHLNTTNRKRAAAFLEAYRFGDKADVKKAVEYIKI